MRLDDVLRGKKTAAENVEEVDGTEGVDGSERVDGTEQVEDIEPESQHIEELSDGAELSDGDELEAGVEAPEDGPVEDQARELVEVNALQDAIQNSVAYDSSETQEQEAAETFGSHTNPSFIADDEDVVREANELREANITSQADELDKAAVPQRATDRVTGLPLPFGKVNWQLIWPAPTSRPLWTELPPLNQLFAAAGGLCLVLALLRATVPPAVAGVQRAAHPYTAAGKQETCLSNLRSLALAMSTYAQDYDGRFPPLERQNKHQPRMTWVSLLQGITSEKVAQCPEGAWIQETPSGSAPLQCSYAMNPVLGQARANEMDEATATLLSADGGNKHDVSLLPPYPTWPSFALRQKDNGAAGVGAANTGVVNTGAVDATLCNFDFRHSRQVGVVYADGHAGTLSLGDWALDSNTWGGSAVIRRSRDRIGERTTQAQELFKRLKAKNIKAAASYLAAQRSRLKPVSAELASLWLLNEGQYKSDNVEELGWHLARAWKTAGDNSLLRQFSEKQTVRCQTELQSVNRDVWEIREMPGQPTMGYHAPSTWSTQEEREGRYHRIYVRSSLPSVYGVLEVGERSDYISPRPIDWHGSEDDLRNRYGKSGYRRLRLTYGSLAGNAASLWEYEVEKPGGPRLRKRYIGFATGWTSYVAGFTAPAKDWALWQPVFDKFLESVQTT